MKGMVVGKVCETAKDGVMPFQDVDDVEAGTKDICWIGPRHIGCCVLEIYGPLQLFFAVLFLAAVVFLIVEYAREGYDTARTIAGVLFILVCLYLVWLGKAIYILKAFKKEIEKFRSLNKKLKENVQKLETQNKEYEKQNMEHQALNQELGDKIGDLSHVEKQLSVLSAECNGSVQQARQLLERLERNIKLDTVNSVFLFFDRADRDKSGKVDGTEVNLFVDNLGFLWRHLPQFRPEEMKAAILEQGGISLEQVHKLVEAMMLEEEGRNPEALARKLEGVFARTSPRSKDVEDAALAPGHTNAPS